MEDGGWEVRSKRQESRDERVAGGRRLHEGVLCAGGNGAGYATDRSGRAVRGWSRQTSAFDFL